MELPDGAGAPLQPTIDRRTAIAMFAAGGLLSGTGYPAFAREAEPVVETARGKVRGMSIGGVQSFKGLPYAASTAGRMRFLPPQPVQPWRGIRDATAFGPTAPQQDRDPEFPAMGEDCLVLNVYAPAARGADPKPVMVWFHGGGWWGGSASQKRVEADNLVREGDVVVVTVNHRLNLFGYFRLDDPDERFADSGNAGVLDMVAALRWVKANIAAFGGDPGNVTIFGCSGGGAKVSALMSLPMARGLFHKAIVQSASGNLRVAEPEEAAAVAHGLAAKLGLAKVSGEALQAVPARNLVDAMLASSGRFRPMLDGRTFTRHPFDPGAPPAARGIPFMAGNVATETTNHLSDNMANFYLKIDDVRLRLARYLPVDLAQTDRILAAYRRSRPDASPSDLLVAITTDYHFMRNTRHAAELQAVAGGAPVYSYIFDWKTPVRDGVLKSPHGIEVPFIFGTTATVPQSVGTGTEPGAMSKIMMRTWAAFARTGNPNNSMLPHWPAFEAGSRTTMMLDLASHVEKDPGGEARASLDGLPGYEYNMLIGFPLPVGES